MRLKKHYYLAISGILVVLFGTLGYVLLEKASFIDSLYMTIITITSVGYREVIPLSNEGKIFTIFLIIIGLGTILYIISYFAEETLEVRIRKIFGKRRIEKVITKMKNHTILAGFGRTGRLVAEELKKRKKKFLVIEKDPNNFSIAENMGYTVIHGDASDEEILKSAGIERAKFFISVLPTDADNIYACLTAKELNPDIFVITRAFEPHSEKKLLKAGANKVISLHKLGALKIANAVSKPNVLDFFEIISEKSVLPLSVEEVKIKENSRLSGVSLMNSGLREKYGIMVIAIKRKNEVIFNPPPDIKLIPGDILIVLGDKEKIKEFEGEKGIEQKI